MPSVDVPVSSTVSGAAIVRTIVGFPAAALQIQVETVDERKALAQTDAGQDLAAELARLAEAHKEELAGLRGEMAELLSAKDAQHKTEIDELNDWVYTDVNSKWCSLSLGCVS